MMMQKTLKIILFFIALVCLESYLNDKKHTYITLKSDIKNQEFMEAIAYSSLTYFSTFIFQSKQHNDFNLTFINQKSCSPVPYKINNKNIYLCSIEKSHHSADFNQLKATIDSPLVRKLCRINPNCQLPEELSDILPPL